MVRQKLYISNINYFKMKSNTQLSKENIIVRGGFLSKRRKPTEFLCSDVACYGNPGAFEFRVMNHKKEILVTSPLFDYGTNNIGEFLGIAAAFYHAYQKNIDLEVFSDSQVAIGWIASKKCKTKELGISNRLREIIFLAESFLKDIDTSKRLYYWQTKQWGEIPADYSRK